MLTIIEFTAAWCPPCKALAPILEKVASRHGVRLEAYDVEEHVELAARFDVKAMPTVVVCDDGRELERFIGLRSESFVDGVVTRALAPAVTTQS
jgi:thioredoxin 1